MDPRQIGLVVRTATPGALPTAANVRGELTANLLGALYFVPTDASGNIVNAQDLQDVTDPSLAAQRFAQRAASYLYAATRDLPIFSPLIQAPLSDTPNIIAERGLMTFANMAAIDDDIEVARGVSGARGNADDLFDGMWGAVVNSRALGFDGSAAWDRLGSGTATNLAALSATRAALAVAPGEWSLNSAPAANTAATATRAAGGAGVRHVLTSWSGDLNAVNAVAAPFEFVVRDGATGVGAILYRRRFIALAGDSKGFELSGLHIVGSANTAMTVETVGAPGAGNFATISASGFSTV